MWNDLQKWCGADQKPRCFPEPRTAVGVNAREYCWATFTSDTYRTIPARLPAGRSISGSAKLSELEPSLRSSPERIGPDGLGSLTEAPSMSHISGSSVEPFQLQALLPQHDSAFVAEAVLGPCA